MRDSQISETPLGERAFSNDPIDVSTIPRLRDEDFSPVDPKYLTVSLIGYGIWTVMVIVICSILATVLPDNNWIPLVVLAGLLFLTVLSVIGTILGVKNIGYQVRQHDLSYRHGVLTKTVSTVPFIRVQHARVTQGPVERLFGISKLAVNSAGPDLHISGLAFDEAERLRALVVERAGELTEEHDR